MEWDYVIAGAGSAGCALASRLSADRRTTVLLLEAGPRDGGLMVKVPAGFSKLFKGPLDWNYATVPQAALAGRELYWPRGRLVGGCSAINAQIWVRGHRLDYDGWAAQGAAGWAYADVLPLFERLEDVERGPLPGRGQGGPVRIAELREPNPATGAFLDAAGELGIPRAADVNGPELDGVDTCQVTQQAGRRWSAADAYLAPAAGRKNLTILTGAQATRVLLEDGRAVGIEYLRRGRKKVARAAAEVILAGGAVNSPQLLLLSGVGPAEELRALGIPVAVDLPGVGRNLQDHLACGLVVGCPLPVTLATAETAANLARFLLLGRGPLTSNVAEAHAFVRLTPGAPAPDVELLFGPAPFIEHGLVRPPGHAISLGAILLQPRSAGALRLRSPDPLQAPVIDPAYLTDPEGEDLRLLTAGVKLARELLRTRALGPYVGAPIQPEDLDLDDRGMADFVRRKAETMYHPVGTCRMGVDPLAVVDPALRVHGVAGLRVADASVMPRIIRGHTHAPATLIGERAAELVLARAEGRASSTPAEGRAPSAPARDAGAELGASSPM
jgi:choline dehydrogenase